MWLCFVFNPIQQNGGAGGERDPSSQTNAQRIKSNAQQQQQQQ
jgi:hypothetical protein